MKLSVIKKKAAEKAKKMGTYHIEDGIHEGTLVSAEYNEENDRVYLKFELTDGTIFKCSTDLADYNSEPLYNIISPFMDDYDEFDFEDTNSNFLRLTTANTKSLSVTTINFNNYIQARPDFSHKVRSWGGEK